MITGGRLRYGNDMKRPVPTMTESPFGFDEFFFSTTNKRGVIASGNDVFVRVSAYPREQILGAPHSIIRHPDMPRAVFKVLWDFIQSGKSIGAYVKNMASNGSYYWVYAFVFPIDEGYLSIRFKPSSEIFNVVEDLYREILDFEKENDDLDKSVELLLQKIQEKGFSSYDEFMVQAALTELESRGQKVKELGQARTGSQGDYKERQKVEAISDVSEAALENLADAFQRIQDFQNSRQIFEKTIEDLSEGFNHLKYISFNMTISAAKFGTVAASLGVVSKEFSELSGQIEEHFKGLNDFIQKLSSVIQQCAFRISALHVQMLLVDFFVKESIAKLRSSDNAFAQLHETQADFSKLFKEYSLELQKEISSLNQNLKEIQSKFDEVRKFITGLEVIKQIGAVESARVDEVKTTFVHYLEEMDRFIALLRKSALDITSQVDQLSKHVSVISDSSETLSASVEQIFVLAADLAPQIEQI